MLRQYLQENNIFQICISDRNLCKYDISNLKNYRSNVDNVIFYDVNSKNDLKKISNHIGKKSIFWTESIKNIDKQLLISNLKKETFAKNTIDYLCDSEDVQKYLKSIGYDCKLLAEKKKKINLFDKFMETYQKYKSENQISLEDYENHLNEQLNINFPLTDSKQENEFSNKDFVNVKESTINNENVLNNKELSSAEISFDNSKSNGKELLSTDNSTSFDENISNVDESTSFDENVMLLDSVSIDESKLSNEELTGLNYSKSESEHSVSIEDTQIQSDELSSLDEYNLDSDDSSSLDESNVKSNLNKEKKKFSQKKMNKPNSNIKGNMSLIDKEDYSLDEVVGNNDEDTISFLEKEIYELDNELDNELDSNIAKLKFNKKTRLRRNLAKRKSNKNI